jgi:septal ring factor EnvC (AmiA/AmiB activator)
MPMMTSPLRRIATAILAFALVSSTGLVPAVSQVTEEDVEAARTLREAAAAERAAAIENLDQAVAAYEAVRGELEALTFAVGRLRGRIDAYQDETRDLRDEVRDRAVQSYMNGDERDPVARVFSPETVQQSIIAREVLAQAVESEAERLHSLSATTAEMERLQEELDTDSARLFELQAEADAIANRMNDLYEVADLVYEEVDEEFHEVKAERDEQVRREEEARRQSARLEGRRGS